MVARTLQLGFFSLALMACTAEPPRPPAGDPIAGDPIGDPGPGDAPGDPGAGDPVPGDPGSGDPLAGDAGDSGPGELFDVRVPQPHVMTCDGGTGPSTFYDHDHVCLVPALGVEVYIEATPTTCVTLLAERAYYDDVTGWVKRGGTVSEIPAAYDAGHHGNDVIHFELDGTAYFVWHSSFGYGWRACAPPDCLRTCAAGAGFDTCGPSGTWVVDGCARDTGGPPPPAPVTCVVVDHSGSVPELHDPWDDGPGAPYPLLPCLGDITN